MTTGKDAAYDLVELNKEQTLAASVQPKRATCRASI